MIRMKSKLHGFCHANDRNEEAYLRKLGWIEENENFPGEQAEEVAAPEVPDTTATPTRRGRKPKE